MTEYGWESDQQLINWENKFVKIENLATHLIVYKNIPDDEPLIFFEFWFPENGASYSENNLMCFCSFVFNYFFNKQAIKDLQRHFNSYWRYNQWWWW